MAASLNEATEFPWSEKKRIWCSAAQASKKVKWYIARDNTCCKKLCNSIWSEEREIFTDITVKLDKLQSNYCGILLASPGKLEI